MKYRFLLILTILPFAGLTQEVRDYDPFYTYENIPSSPESSTLGQYGQISASSYNGKANLSIPIYSLDFEGIKIPFALSYDSGGVQVSAEAGWVGLNWNLSSGFGVHRKIYGFDDLSSRIAGEYAGAPLNGYIYNNIIPELNEGQSKPYLSYDDILNVHHSFSIRDRIGAGTRFMDTQPDVFTLNVFDNTYTFILKKKRYSNIIETEVFNSNTVKITYDLSKNSFTLVDDKGFTFYFNTKEINTTFSSLTETTPPTSYQACINSIFAAYDRQNESLITNWSLDKVISPRGKTLNFNYQKGVSFSFPNYTVEPRNLDSPTYANWPAEQYAGPPGYTDQHSLSTTIIENNYLSSITGDFGTIKFKLGKRLDLSTGNTINILSKNGFGQKFLKTSQSIVRAWQGTGKTYPNDDNTPFIPLKLDGISVFNTKNEEIVKVGFMHSYFDSDKQSDPVRERFLRLKLDGVLVNDQKYTFEYLAPNSLPAKDSNGVDFWGFNNGITSNKTLSPKIGRFITARLALPGNGRELGQSFVKFSGADRSSHFESGKIGLLQKIIYPTKGSSEFIYEPHETVISTPEAFKITEFFPGNKRLRWTNMTDEAKFNFTYQYLKCAQNPDYNYFESSRQQVSGPPGTPQNIGQPFVVNNTAILNVEGTINTYTGWDGIQFWAASPILAVEEIYSGKEYVLFTYADAPSAIGMPANQVLKRINLTPGTYRVVRRTATLPSGDSYQNYPPIPASFFQSTEIILYANSPGNPTGVTNLTERFEIGGARIKKILHKDSNGSFISGTLYDYNFPGGAPGLSSSGLLMDDLIFHSKASGFHSYNPRGYNDFTLKSYNQVGTNQSAQGSHIGYSFVREMNIDTNGNNLGWIEREYHNKKNEYYTDSFCLPYSYDVIKGNGDPYINILGVKTKWFCSGVSFGNDCTGQQKYYSSLGNVCIQNTMVLGLPLKYTFQYANGNVLQEKIHDKAGSVLKQTANSYTYLNGHIPTSYFSGFMNVAINVKTINNQGAVTSSVMNTSEGPWGTDHHSYFSYKFPLHSGLVSRLSSSEVTETLDKKMLTTKTTSNYNKQTHYITQQRQFINDKEALWKDLEYPYDGSVYNNPGMAALRKENRLSTIVGMKTYRNGMKLSTLKYHYNNNTQTGGKTLVTAVETSKGDGPFTTEVSYDKYDQNGNLLQSKYLNNIPISYLWGYHTQYPVAKIENALYEDVTSATVGLNFSVINNPSSEIAMQNELQKIRLKFPEARVTTYTYKPLVGLSSATDPAGNTVYYLYDAFNRLQTVKDQNGNILNEYEYHYKNQN